MSNEWDAQRLQSAPFDSERVDEMTRLIEPYLKGLHPGEQGAILADLLAIWLAGFPASLHERLIAAHIGGVRKLVPLYIQLNRGDDDD